MTFLAAFYGLFLGSSLASFACVVAERVPAGVSVNGRSRCGCGRQLRAVENIPLVGWLRARGVASCCGAKIPARYFYAEAICGLFGAIGGLLILGGLQGAPGARLLLAGGIVLLLAAPAAACSVLWARR